MFARLLLTLLLLGCALPGARAFTLMHYNVGGNGATNWSTNAVQVQAIGRQMLHLQPDAVTFNEIPYGLSYEMTNFIKAYLPGYFLAINSGTDGYLRSAIASRHSVVRSRSWLDGAPLNAFGYNGTFTRDLFEAVIAVPGYSNHLHLFTTHLKAFSDADSAARRAAEAGAVSNFFVNTYLSSNAIHPYVLTGDLNEDINNPPSTSGQPIQRLANPATRLVLTTPFNPVTRQRFTHSIQGSLNTRFDYILPGSFLASNIATSQVFRTDRVTPLPPGLLASDSAAASDHLPVLMTFHNPYDTHFAIHTVTASNQFLNLAWQATTGRIYRVEASSNFVNWTTVSTNLTAVSANLGLAIPRTNRWRFYRVFRLP
jgi:endonuclease/exonuclease/phosphatase family metal-dependent hydrolase